MLHDRRRHSQPLRPPCTARGDAEPGVVDGAGGIVEDANRGMVEGQMTDDDLIWRIPGPIPAVCPFCEKPNDGTVELFESLVVSAEANICRENSALVYATLAQAHATMALVEVNRRIAMILEGTVSSQKSMDPDEHNWPALNRHEW